MAVLKLFTATAVTGIVSSDGFLFTFCNGCSAAATFVGFCTGLTSQVAELTAEAVLRFSPESDAFAVVPLTDDQDPEESR